MDEKTTSHITSAHALAGILHLADPALPIGGFIHSWGLETYTYERMIRSKEDLQHFLRGVLFDAARYNDGLIARFAYEATREKDIAELVRLCAICDATKSAKESRHGSVKMGERLAKIFERHSDIHLLESLSDALKAQQTDMHYCVIFAVVAALLDVPVESMLVAFYYNMLVGAVVNGVKLVPLGQLEGQEIIFDFLPKLDALVEETMQFTHNDIGRTTTAWELRSMQHERLYTRLYMS